MSLCRVTHVCLSVLDNLLILLDEKLVALGVESKVFLATNINSKLYSSFRDVFSLTLPLGLSSIPTMRATITRTTWKGNGFKLSQSTQKLLLISSTTSNTFGPLRHFPNEEVSASNSTKYGGVRKIDSLTVLE
ncbi:hypothetical protein YC2023_040670 [Brassica napus]